jgi:hypothetical protein
MGAEDGFRSPFGLFLRPVSGPGDRRYLFAVMLTIVTIRIASPGLRDHVLASAA